MASRALAAFAAGVLVFGLLAGAAATGVAPTNVLGLVASSFPTPIHHVIVIFFENEPYSAVRSDGGAIWNYGTQYASASQAYALCHPSAANYLGAFSDATHGQCGSDTYHVYSAPSIASLADAAGVSWVQEAQSMPSPCDTSNVNGATYVSHHVPALFFKSVVSNSAYCDSHVLSFPASGVPFASSTPPAYAFVTPDNNHNKPISASDAFAKLAISTWSAKSWWSSTTVILTYDESADTDTTCPSGLTGVPTSGCGGQIFMAAVGPYSSGVGTVSAPVSLYSVYATSVWLLGLPAASVGSPMKSLFSFAPQGSPLSVSASASPSSLAAGSTVALSASASGGQTPYSYAWSALPPGCDVSVLASFSCVPSQAGTYDPTVTVTDAAGATAHASAALKVTSPSGPALALVVSPGSPTPSEAFTVVAMANGGTTPYTYSWGAIPAGCTVSGSSVACPTGLAAGTYAFDASVSDAAGRTASATVSVTVSAPAAPAQPLVSTALAISLVTATLAGAGVALLVASRPEWGLPLLGAGLAGFFLF